MLMTDYCISSEVLVVDIPTTWLPTMHSKYRIESSQDQAAAREPEICA